MSRSESVTRAVIKPEKVSFGLFFEPIWRQMLKQSSARRRNGRHITRTHGEVFVTMTFLKSTVDSM